MKGAFPQCNRKVWLHTRWSAKAITQGNKHHVFPHACCFRTAPWLALPPPLFSLLLKSKMDALSSFCLPHGNTFKGSIQLAGVQCLIVYQRVIAAIAFGQQALRCRIATQPCHCRPGLVKHWMLESCATLRHLGYITAIEIHIGTL